MPPAASPERTTLDMFTIDPDNVPAIIVYTPFIAAAFRHPDVGARTAPGLAARQG
jgi:hypothetical protein